MKNIFFIGFIALIMSCKHDVISNDSLENLKKLSSVKTQIFELGTLSKKEIIGTKGTVIFYDRDNLNVENEEKIILKLEEYYDFKDLILNNIQTVTDDDLLLQSSGVLNIKFYSNNKEINLKKGKSLKIKIPNNRMSGNRLFNGKVDSLNQFTWEVTDTFPIINSIKIGRTRVERGIYVLNEFIETDTIGWTKSYQNYLTIKIADSIKIETWKKQFSERIQLERKISESISKIDNLVDIYNLNWINIDQYIGKKDIRTRKLQYSFKGLKPDSAILYFAYDGINGFTSNILTEQNQIIENKEIEGLTKVFVIAYSEDSFWYADIPLNASNEYTINLKKISENELLKKFEKYQM